MQNYIGGLNRVSPLKIEMLFHLSVAIVNQINYKCRSLSSNSKSSRMNTNLTSTRRGVFWALSSRSEGVRLRKMSTQTMRHPKKCVGTVCKKSSKEQDSSKTKDEKPSTGKRGPTGYNLFVKNQGVAITEAAKQWKNLSNSTREKWNVKAKAVK